MSEDEIIEMFFLQHFFGVDDQPFFVFAEEVSVVISGSNSAFLAEITHEANPEVGMESCKQPLGNPIRK